MRSLRIFLIALMVTILIVNGKQVLTAQTPDLETKEKLVIAVKDNSRPLAFLNNSGELQGLEIDIAQKLAQELLGNQGTVTLVPVSNQERLNLVMEGKVDLAIARMTANASRSQLVDFSSSYYLDGTGIITKSPLIKNIQDLAAAKIALLDESSTIPVISNRIKTAKLVPVNSYQQAYDLLESGEALAFAADQSILTGWTQEHPEYRLIAQSLSGEPLAIVMPKGLQYVSLRTQVNNALTTWRNNGWLKDRVDYWGLP
ncbi:transporter substrate-binding domain-containing protein [Gloeocapsa sp. PCC 73106]|uniref:transporter substrate-binding domain-containing protein n=1 Tax=Gloeocapsa sp. PCC 73106 TaxID=102232 RepID=UPI0002AD1672|nr:transporter substrate-binding domain-containing protein [Gloeocapsa sp. PCC 73106]ELR97202.1 periplasmic component of amino acid ABC-type transporter/signal transduction system [Gloeocapsa sp. PCC 73106]